jgi:hypothetical protein
MGEQLDKSLECLRNLRQHQLDNRYPYETCLDLIERKAGGDMPGPTEEEQGRVKSRAPGPRLGDLRRTISQEKTLEELSWKRLETRDNRG